MSPQKDRSRAPELRAAWLTHTPKLALDPDSQAQHRRAMPTGWTTTVPEARCEERGRGVLGWWSPEWPVSEQEQIRRSEHTHLFGDAVQQKADEHLRWTCFYPARHMVEDGHGVWRLAGYGQQQRARGISDEPEWVWHLPRTIGGPHELMPKSDERCELPARVCCPRCHEMNVVRPPWAADPG